MRFLLSACDAAPLLQAGLGWLARSSAAALSSSCAFSSKTWPTASLALHMLSMSDTPYLGAQLPLQCMLRLHAHQAGTFSK